MELRLGSGSTCQLVIRLLSFLVTSVPVSALDLKTDATTVHWTKLSHRASSFAVSYIKLVVYHPGFRDHPTIKLLVSFAAGIVRKRTTTVSLPQLVHNCRICPADCSTLSFNRLAGPPCCCRPCGRHGHVGRFVPCRLGGPFRRCTRRTQRGRKRRG
jgi:hypothetical protein